MSVLSATTLLFLVMDPLGNVPMFLSALKNVDQRRQKAVIVRELLIALVVLAIFLFAGTFILSLVCAWFLSGIILLSAHRLVRILGPKVLDAIERLMGLLLTVVAVQMLINGIKVTFFPS